MSANKLILGTANWNPQGEKGYPIVPISEIQKILDCAKEAGILMIDTAESYNTHDIIKKYAKGFCIYTKTRDWRVHLDWGENELRGILYHYTMDEDRIELPFIHRWINLGSSVYELHQLPTEVTRIVEVPMSIYVQQFKEIFGEFRTIFVRGIFARGKLLKEGYTVKNCLDYVKQFRPDGIIVGPETVKEFEEIVRNI